MMLFAEPRRKLALFICPEIRKERVKLSRSDFEKIKRSGVIDRMSDVSGPKVNLSYKAIKNICDRRSAADAVAVRHFLHPDEEHLGSHLISCEQDHSACNPSFREGVESRIGGSIVVSECLNVSHASLLCEFAKDDGRSPADLHKVETNPTRFLSLLARFEDHWIADLIGAVGLFAIGWLWMLLGYAWGLE